MSTLIAWALLAALLTIVLAVGVVLVLLVWWLLIEWSHRAVRARERAR